MKLKILLISLLSTSLATMAMRSQKLDSEAILHENQKLLNSEYSNSIISPFTLKLLDKLSIKGLDCNVDETETHSLEVNCFKDPKAENKQLTAMLSKELFTTSLKINSTNNLLESKANERLDKELDILSEHYFIIEAILQELL